MTLLALEDVHTYYGEAHILQGVSLSVEGGEVVTLIGRNGAGKTTTLRSIMGIARARQGRVRFGGEEITRLATHEIARRGIAYVPEERRILPNLTVLDNLRLGMLAAGGDGGRRRGPFTLQRSPNSPRARVLADGAGARISAQASPEERIEQVFGCFPRLRERSGYKGRFLSGGEQQMLAIARGMVAAPSLMLVDEPTEGLSPLVVRALTEVLAEINRNGTTILLVEQTLDVALALSSRLYVMDQGRIQFDGTPDEFRRDPTIAQRFLGV